VIAYIVNILLLNNNPTFRSKSKGPQCLFKVTPRRTILEKQIQILNRSFKGCQISIIEDYKNKKIKNIIKSISNVSIIENQYFDITNCLYNISLGLYKNIDDLLILPGNTYFPPNIFNGFNRKHSQIWITNEIYDIGCSINNGLIENIMWGLPNYWTNIGYFTGKELEMLKNICNKENIKKLFFFEGINYCINNGGEFHAVYKNNITMINKSLDV